eukprot:TRINITY_DN2693_c0_g1_i1.p1 TRINITY_DN2693_c0_g1~~TRINITY_DN2693_c0_g1_i1.p1  ORF type:complete len:138 (-),score=40.23 TRINITY_DN2693_c0_g1_i1:156-569(-)
MSTEKTWTLRTRKMLANPLLQRKQMIIELTHHGLANVSKKDVSERLAKLFKVQDVATVVVFDLKTAFGGGKTTGFALIYDTLAALKKYEPLFRQARAGLLKREKTMRKQRKEKKNRAKKLRGVQKVKGKKPKKEKTK